ncbi:hypothetical protein BCR43DRAFT_498313 [Syncephalastrum racemosum]|uniref:Uncharacterized protein n=1 Tax=Syncephalastrum racemosum TaxID=13706 RepID=A0A1X2H1U7_SYNRA|nr:hypothetical protein BCR43DRAFT_498313 [Syncephalastrum racemosum]
MHPSGGGCVCLYVRAIIIINILINIHFERSRPCFSCLLYQVFFPWQTEEQQQEKGL